ncbi:MAG TPA: HAD-IIIA family hydrolase [Gemmatimonadales bacterium]|nr:HAD-IIIA family hydrolase [Gemmatimonadales bacterium]
MAGLGSAARRYRLWIFDADGTLRRTTVPGRPCPRHSDEWELLPGVRRTLREVPWNSPDGPWLGVASNQDQVGAGLIPLTTARRLLQDLMLAAAGVRLPAAATQLCPHPLGVKCRCRKPGPAMIERILAHYGIPAGESVLVGDQATDREAAAGAGVAFIEADDLFGWAQST